MSPGQIEAPHGRLQAPIVIALLFGAFAFGGLAGFSLPRAAGSSHVDAAAGSAAGSAIPGVAVNNMSDAADRAFAGSAIPGVAVNNMSDAADRAFAGSAIPGVAVNNMSDAADRALAGSAIPGVAVNNGQKAFHLAKVCDTATHCVVTSSSYKAIPAGSEITYSGPDANHLTAVITAKNGTAVGHCAIGSLVGFGDPSLAATCTFNRGTGRLAQFHLSVNVTTTAQFNPWYWDGWYWFG